jgi:membrane protease YdiL (CAAX protease family)
MRTAGINSKLRMQPAARMAQKRPLLVFFLLAFGLAWLFFLPVVIPIQNIPPEFIVVPTFAPTVAAVITHWLANRDLRAFAATRFTTRVLLAAFAGPVLIAIAFTVIPAFLLGAGPLARWRWAVFTSVTVINWSTILGGPLGEEPGWRGYALPRLEALFGPIWASAVLGLVWALWHAPLFLIPGLASVSPASFAGILVGVSFLMTFVARLSHSYVLIPILMHAAFNTSSKWLNGLLEPVGWQQNMSPGLILALCWVPVAVVLAFLDFRGSRRRPHLGT